MTDLNNDIIEKVELTNLEHNKFKGFGEYSNKLLQDNEKRIGLIASIKIMKMRHTFREAPMKKDVPSAWGCLI